MNCGLLGEKLGHSYSPFIHKYLGDYTYSLFEISSDNLGDFLKNGDFHAVNVTIPYKQAVIPYCASLSPIAFKLGAVNILVRQDDGTLIGHNSDYFGFETLLLRSGLQVNGKKALVLGTGGAAKTAIASLQSKGANVVVISRSGENHYGNLQLHSDAAVIVNATPVGMYPHTGVSPLSLDLFPQLEGVLDAIYNPARTQLLLDAEERGLVAMNGLWMLVAQAKEASEWFTDNKIPDEQIDALYRILQKQMQNIVLIGMPGCGKTTVGKLIAEKTSKKFVDADKVILEKTGCTAGQIIKDQGEEAFRKLESQVLSELGKQSSLVIATGGGCVTREENFQYLHQNGQIFCLHRALERLSTEGRPLSQRNSLAELYRVRQPLYERFADEHIDNNGDVSQAVSKILEIWEG
ncbi:MAG: AAA family ATPase [Ruminococcaceae bacterium]|nr:AAA family ATPase [Oscillospiraceae bacterium]